MEPISNNWAKDWRLGVNPEVEARVSLELIAIFSDFWAVEKMETRSKSTRQRYAGGLCALGGFIVKEAVDEEAGESGQQRLFAAVEAGEGPWVFPENEVWQRELDTVCRKLRKYLLSRR